MTGDIGSASWSEWATVVSAIAAALSALFAALTAMQVAGQTRLQNKAIEAQAYLRIYEEWNQIYPTYRALLAEDLDWNSIRAYSDVRSYMRSDHWLRIRSVLVFYEFLAGCVKRRLLDVRFVRDIVSISPALWDKYRDLIYFLREETGTAYLYKEMEEVLFS